MLRLGYWRLLRARCFAAGAVNRDRFGQDFGGDAVTVQIDNQGTVEALLDFDAGMGVRDVTLGGQRRDVDDVLADSHCVVVEDDASVLEAEELV